MKTLAQVVVLLMEQLTTAEEPGIDWQACGDITNDMWFELAKSSPAERQALAEAARRRILLEHDLRAAAHRLAAVIDAVGRACAA